MFTLFITSLHLNWVWYILKMIFYFRTSWDFKILEVKQGDATYVPLVNKCRTLKAISKFVEGLFFLRKRIWYLLMASGQFKFLLLINQIQVWCHTQNENACTCTCKCSYMYVEFATYFQTLCIYFKSNVYN